MHPGVCVDMPPVDFLHFFFSLKNRSSSVRLHRDHDWIALFQVKLQNLDRIGTWTLTQTLQDTDTVATDSLRLYSWAHCLAGKQIFSQVSCRLHQVFSSRTYLYYSAVILPSTLTSFPGPAAEKHPHTMMLPLPCFMLGRGCLWWPTSSMQWSSLLGTSDQRSFFQLPLESLSQAKISCKFLKFSWNSMWSSVWFWGVKHF